MEIWSRKRIGLSHLIQLKKGWNTVDDGLLQALTPNQGAYLNACMEEGLISEDEDKSTGPRPGKGKARDDGKRLAADLVEAIRACKSAKELDALNVSGDTRQTVAAAYAQKLQDLG